MIRRMSLQNKKDLTDKFIWDEKDPDYIISTERVFTSKEFYEKFKKYLNEKKRDKIFIFHTGECVDADLSLFDYVITYDVDLKSKDRAAYGVCPSILDFENKNIFRNNLTYDEAKARLKNLKFCNFIYSHAQLPRDEFFHEISKYKQVDSLGPHLHNVDIPESRSNSDWFNLSIELKLNYKFSIAMENAEFRGYNTEKIISSFRAHTIPIYWGDPAIEEFYNPEAFINCNNYKNIGDIVEIIKELDNDDEKYLKMVTQSWMTPEQEAKILKLSDDYEKFIDNIFTQNIHDAVRRPLGIWNEIYINTYSRNIYKPSLLRRILRKCKRIVKKLIGA